MTLSSISINQTIEAPLNHVFSTIADIRNYSSVISDIVDIEFLSDRQLGVGTLFKETRNFSGKTTSTILKVTEYQENERIRLVSESGGTVWDSLYTFKHSNGQTNVTLQMDARPHKWWAYILNFVMKGMIKRAIQKDMDMVKQHCEN